MGSGGWAVEVGAGSGIGEFVAGASSATCGDEGSELGELLEGRVEQGIGTGVDPASLRYAGTS